MVEMAVAVAVVGNGGGGDDDETEYEAKSLVGEEASEQRLLLPLCPPQHSSRDVSTNVLVKGTVQEQRLQCEVYPST